MPTTLVPQIVAIGEVLWDRLPSGDRLGGAPGNFAVLSARLGNRAALVSSIGDDDYGTAAMQLLRQPNLDLTGIQTNGDHPTGTVEVCFSPDNQPSYTISTEVAWDFLEPTPALREIALTADSVCFGTLGQRHEVARAAIHDFVTATRAECVRVCDVNLRMPFCTPEVLRWSMDHATVIKISDEELAMVFALLEAAGVSGPRRPTTPRLAAEFLLSSFPGCQLVAVTLGPNGSLLTSRRGVAEHPGFPIKLMDTVGAGDAFTAGLAHAYLRATPLEAMAEIGNLCGSFVASQSGATPPLPPGLIARIAALQPADNSHGSPDRSKARTTPGSQE